MGFIYGRITKVLVPVRSKSWSAGVFADEVEVQSDQPDSWQDGARAAATVNLHCVTN